MSAAEELTARKADILSAAARWGARNVRVFGSVARGDDRPDSDIDLLVDMDPDRTLFDLGGLVMDLKDLLGKNVDVHTEQGISHYFRAKVLAEARSL